MFKKYSTRRQFFNYGKLSLLFLLNSCSNSVRKIKIAFQSSFYPKSLKDTFPAIWQKENINFSKLKLENNKIKLSNSDFILINDGWLNSINYARFQNVYNLFSNDLLDNRSRDFLNSFQEYQREKLLPIGVVPYAVILKNNKELIDDASNSWDFLLADKLKGKIIFPQSLRIIISISKKISAKNSLSKLKAQAMLFEDKNSINWLINSRASVAIVPVSLCEKYLRVDSRLSMIFPNTGVPLIWNFLLTKSKFNNRILIDWIKSLEKKATIDELANQGWYLPFKNEYSQNKYNIKIENNNNGPSKKCWENSWSFSPLNDEEKSNLENLWNQSLIP
ncbi:hypothetical protein OA860_00680 [Prochlorococcus sp. AH-716-E13]|nr:hypothetical protein [Prochlorococcus sp. AH-716-E13]